MPKRFLVFDLATSTIDAAVTAAVEAAIAAAPASNIVKITVADQAARYSLTQAQVQNGDYVFQTDTATLYEVLDQTMLTADSGYVALATVTAAQISDATASGRALLTGNVSIGTGSDTVTLETSGAADPDAADGGAIGGDGLVAGGTVDELVVAVQRKSVRGPAVRARDAGVLDQDFVARIK